MDENKTLYKQTKKAYKKAKFKTLGVFKIIAIIALVFAIVLTPVSVVLNMFDNTVAAFVGGTFWELENEDKDAQYYEMDFKSNEEMYEKAMALDPWRLHFADCPDPGARAVRWPGLWNADLNGGNTSKTFCVRNHRVYLGCDDLGSCRCAVSGYEYEHFL